MDLRFLASLALVLGLLFVNTSIAAGQVGVCYGRLGNDLPSPTETVELFKQKNIRRVRLYSPDHDVLDALRGSDIEVMLGLPNDHLQNVSSSQSAANTWVQNNVINYVDNVKFRYVSVGNEVNSSMDESQFLVQAMENIDRAVSAAGLSQIKVSTAIYMALLGESYPPSHGAFKREEMGLMEPIIRFLVSRKSPLHLNLYTYFSYAEPPNEIGLDYALFTAPPGTVSDGPLSYQNLFDAMLDAVHWALEKSGGGSVEVVISETGWPTGGGIKTNVENAKIYNNNLINHVNSKNGTPKRPGKIETYIFAMYDENMKPRPDVEKFWGLFHPNKEAKYDVNFG